MSILDKILRREQVTEPTVDELNAIRDERDRVTGKITFLSDKGWGFISSEDIPFTRIFFHWSALEQDTKHFTELNKKDVVSFIPTERKDGVMAIKIKVIE